MENNSSDSSPLRQEEVSKCLRTLGMHPLLMRHAFLELAAADMKLDDISVLAGYTNLMYIDVSRNQLSSLKVLENLPALLQLRARGNRLVECLDFCPVWCTSGRSWSSGHQAVGSMLTLADLRDNQIEALRNLSDHYYLECLLLGNNKIQRIEGLHKLRFLQTLDLSNNNLTVIEGLDNLPIRELNLSHNRIASLQGLSNLPCLSALNVSHNLIVTLAPLRKTDTLTYIDVSHNQIEFIRQVEFLISIPWLQLLSVHHNPCFRKDHYRLRVVYRLQNLQYLDEVAVSYEEKIRAHNLYRSPEGDLHMRERAFAQLCPKFEFVDHAPAQLPFDEEAHLSAEQLSYDPSLDQDKPHVDPAVTMVATEFLKGVLDARIDRIRYDLSSATGKPPRVTADARRPRRLVAEWRSRHDLLLSPVNTHTPHTHTHTSHSCALT